mgnify:CR=1 FL=1
MFEKKKINEQLVDLKKNLENQKNWDDFEKTNKDLKKLNYLSSFLKSIDDLQKSYEDTIELIKITDENTNADMHLELENELQLIEKDGGITNRAIASWQPSAALPACPMAVHARALKKGTCVECLPSVLCDGCILFACGDTSFFFHARLPPREPDRHREAHSMDSRPSEGPLDQKHHHGILPRSLFARAHCFFLVPFVLRRGN